MSQAFDLLESLTESMSGTTGEEHIVIGRDRYVTVPEYLKKIAVQFDHDIETVTFDCPKMWDDKDMSTMKAYVNYMRADGNIGTCLCSDIVADGDIIHFDWTISGNVTQVAGELSFLVCIKKVDAESGTEINHWNSELCTDMYISEGLKCQETILHRYPDIITQLLVRMDIVEDKTTRESMLGYVKDYVTSGDPAWMHTFFESPQMREIIDVYLAEYGINGIGLTISSQQPTDETFWFNTDFEAFAESDGSPIFNTDESFTIPGAPADSKAVGERFGEVDTALAGKARTIALTQAEWDALPDTKYTDGIIYRITDLDNVLSAENIPCLDLLGNPSNVQDELNKKTGGGGSGGETTIDSASDIPCKDSAGNNSNVQDELDKIGTLSELKTTDKSSLVAAVNEQNNKIVDVENELGGLRFGIDGEGNRCYLGADGSLIPFRSGAIRGMMLILVLGNYHYYNISFSTDNSKENRVQSVTYSSGKITAKSNKKGKFAIIVGRNGEARQSTIVEVDSATTIYEYSVGSSGNGSLHIMTVIDVTD